MSLKEKTLEILREKKDRYVSGEELSRNLSISRTAVWKHVRALRAEGYQISASPHLGYQLTAVPDLLLPAEIKRQLKTRRLGRRIHHFSEISSTNDELKRIAEEEPEGTLVVAEVQLGGRGRLARTWYSPPGGLWFSLLLRPDMSAAEAPRLTFMTAVAVAETIREFLGQEAVIKWPNDILVRGKKVAGILTEMSAETDRINYLIIGIGINLNVDPHKFPSSLRKEAGSLMAEYGSVISRVDFLTQLLSALEDEYQALSREGFGKLLRKWRKLDGTKGRWAKVETPEGVIEGMAQGVDSEGNLIVRTDRGDRHIRSGTVLVLGSY